MPGRPRKLQLSPLQRDIMWMLEEAGSEELVTILNTLQAGRGQHEPRCLLVESHEALFGLYRLGLIAWCKDYSRPGLRLVPLLDDEVRILLTAPTFVVWNEREQAWRWNGERAGPHPMVVRITTAGEGALTR